MDDLISRQAAIDAIKGLPTWWADDGGYYDGAQPPMEALLEPNDVISAIDNLPSASTDMSSYSDKLWYLAHERGIREAQQQWIPCSERLPEIGQTVITSSDLGSVREATYKGFDAWTIHGVVHWTDEILSWMPLPEPYKEDE